MCIKNKIYKYAYIQYCMCIKYKIYKYAYIQYCMCIKNKIYKYIHSLAILATILGTAQLRVNYTHCLCVNN